MECGTEQGFAASVITSSVDLFGLGKRLFLFDSWEGPLFDQLSAAELSMIYGNNIDTISRDGFDHFSQVKSIFGGQPSVSLIKGYVPDSLNSVYKITIKYLKNNSDY